MRNPKEEAASHTSDGPDHTGASSFARLRKRSFGGEDVATRPGSEDDEWWPKGPLLPGIQDLLDEFVDKAHATTGLRLVFLMGGAGNGKSYAARELGNALGLATDKGNLARRIYSTTSGSTRIELLNDATIASSVEYQARQKIALAADIDRWWATSSSQPVAAFCCVNRGIVIDELRSLASQVNEVGSFAKAVLAWLATPDSDLALSLGATPLQQPPVLVDDTYREQRFELGGRLIHVAALSVDAHSLFEPMPASAPSRAAWLFREIVERCDAEASTRPDDCPLRANVKQWATDGAAEHWQALLSSAEIASGRLHSYRDVWGLAALSILGPRFVATDSPNELLQHIDRDLERARLTSSVAEKMELLVGLARFRAHNALFRSPIPANGATSISYPLATPAHAGLSLIDPSVWGSADSDAVEAAMQVIALGGYPSSDLDPALLQSAWSPFDKALESAVVDFVCDDSCNEATRRKLISWLGGYFIRLIGTSQARLGNADVVDAWKRCQKLSASGPSPLPVELEAAIRALLFPHHKDAPKDRILVPAFAVRVEPLTASRDGAGPKLAELISHSGIHIRVKRAGARLLVECTQSGTAKVIGQLALDFPLLREARACQGLHAGQTESTAYVEPRIERCRASSLEAMPPSERSLVAVFGGQLEELTR